MAKQDSSIKSFVGKRVSQKQYKIFLANAKTPEERKAIKSLFLSAPVQVFAKNKDSEEAPDLQTDLIK